MVETREIPEELYGWLIARSQRQTKYVVLILQQW